MHKNFRGVPPWEVGEELTQEPSFRAHALNEGSCFYISNKRS